MPDWAASSPASEPSTLEELAIRMLWALGYGIAVAIVYRLSHGRDNREHGTLSTTIVLLCVLIAMVTMIIGSNVARAFSLVGALSIVRFRTVVSDTRDTAFVIFAVVVGMAAGSSMKLAPLAGIPIAGAAAIVMSRWFSRHDSVNNGEWTLTLKVALERDPKTTVGAALDRHLSSHRLIATSTARQGAALELTYRAHLRPSSAPDAFVNDLNMIEGVQSVEFRHA
jgi:hypothetical protein